MDALHTYHGDEDAILGIELYQERALEDVVETIMLYGEYPQPRPLGGFAWTSSRATRRFDLNEWLTENWSQEDIVMLAVDAIINYGDFDGRRLDHARDIETRLKVELKDADFVLEKAEELLTEAREDAE